MNDLKGVDPMDVDHPYEWLKNEFKKGRIWSLSQHISQYMLSKSHSGSSGCNYYYIYVVKNWSKA